MRPLVGDDGAICPAPSGGGAWAAGLFFYHMLEQGYFCGQPRLAYMTLPVPLGDADYAGFLAVFDAFLGEFAGRINQADADAGGVAVADRTRSDSAAPPAPPAARL